MVTRILSPLIALTIATAASSVFGREIAVPLRIDYPFLQSQLMDQVFRDDPGDLLAWRDAKDCGRLHLTNPEVGYAGGYVQILTDVAARVGAAIGAACVTVPEWSGKLAIQLQPETDLQSPTLRFRVKDSALYDSEGRPAALAGTLWNWVNGHVHPRLDALRIDLNPVTDELVVLLGDILDDRDRAQLEAIASTLALNDVRAERTELHARLTFELPETMAVVQAPPPELPLTEAELANWQASWQQWDAFLTFVIRTAATDTTSEELRSELLVVLLEARHEFASALTEWQTQGGDPIRALFLRSWEHLAKTLRRIDDSLPGNRAFRYLRFVSAADALVALDAAGPGYGFEVSTDALRRLARTLSPSDTRDPLFYDTEIDTELRVLFGFGAPIPAPAESPDMPFLHLLPGRSAWAEQYPIDSKTRARLNRWVPDREELHAYLVAVRNVLAHAAGASLQESALNRKFENLYRRLVPTTAWQESCWRQVVERDGRIDPLLSSAGAVGIMQVSTRVWRGFYDPHALTTDMIYNAGAGSEILLHYLTDYAIRRGEHEKTGKVDNLARATYAAYNGGPSHLTRYRTTGTPESLRKIDSAFWEKYRTIRTGNELAVSKCFGVDLPPMQETKRQGEILPAADFSTQGDELE